MPYEYILGQIEYAQRVYVQIDIKTGAFQRLDES